MMLGKVTSSIDLEHQSVSLTFLLSEPLPNQPTCSKNSLYALVLGLNDMTNILIVLCSCVGSLVWKSRVVYRIRKAGTLGPPCNQR